MVEEPQRCWCLDWYISRERQGQAGSMSAASASTRHQGPARLATASSTCWIRIMAARRACSCFLLLAHPKATLPAPPKLVKLTGARAVPILACYDMRTRGCYRLEMEPPVRPLSHPRI